MPDDDDGKGEEEEKQSIHQIEGGAEGEEGLGVTELLRLNPVS